MKNDSLRDLYVNTLTTLVFYLSSGITYSMRETQTALNVHINLSVRVCMCVSERFEQQELFCWCCVIKSHES